MSKRYLRTNDRQRVGFGHRPKKRQQQGSSLRVEQLIKKADPSLDFGQEEVAVTFADFNLPAKIGQAITSQGFTSPTPIQAQAIPVILSGKDVVGIAHTGTGKTASFIIPLLAKYLENQHQKVMIVAPTRELALQINQELQRFAKYLQVYSVLCIGGTSMQKQYQSMKRNHQFVIGTPGRIKDLAERGLINFSSFNVIVLDEVDRMLDMGFINDIRGFMQQLPQNRQSLFFSATISPPISHLVESFSQRPVTISLKTQATSNNVDQDVVRLVGDESKKQALNEILRQKEVKKVIIFGRTKRGVNKLFQVLQKYGHPVAVIHGNKSQPQRQKALQAFTSNKVSILVATDVAARGIDVPDVTHVINYDLPQTYDDYIHRIGRTGRAGKKGYALTFV